MDILVPEDMKFVKLEVAFYKADFEKGRGLSKGWFSRAIAHHARGTHSHVEFIFTFVDGTSLCFSSSERDGGTRFKSEEIITKHPFRWDRLTVSTDSEKIERIFNFCVRENHKKYDWMGVSRFKFSFLNENPEIWYCSEIIQTGLHNEELSPKLYSIHPEDLFRILRFIYSVKESSND